jgi:hypothetical protein
MTLLQHFGNSDGAEGAKDARASSNGQRSLDQIRSKPLYAVVCAKNRELPPREENIPGKRILRCKAVFMIAHTKRSRMTTQQKPVIFGTISWIANELIGIRTLEHTLSEELEAGKQADKRFLLDQIRDLNVRVKALDLALDDYVCAGRERWS